MLGEQRIVRNALGYPDDPLHDGMQAIPDYTIEVALLPFTD